VWRVGFFSPFFFLFCSSTYPAKSVVAKKNAIDRTILVLLFLFFIKLGYAWLKSPHATRLIARFTRAIVKAIASQGRLA